MVLVSVIALSVEAGLAAVARAARDHAPLLRSLIDEARGTFGLTAALSTTGALIALAERSLGVIAIPLFLFPLLLTQFAVRRYAMVRATYRQTIRALSRLTEIGGYTEPGHASRVAGLATAIGRDLGMSEREVLDLEYAALLHDIGQVSLAEPIPRGATVMAAPADQRRIAHDGAEIVRQTGVLDERRARSSRRRPRRTGRCASSARSCRWPAASSRWPTPTTTWPADGPRRHAGWPRWSGSTSASATSTTPGWSTPWRACCAAPAERAPAGPPALAPAQTAPSAGTTRRAGPVWTCPPRARELSAPACAGQCWSVVSSGSGLTRGSPASTK